MMGIAADFKNFLTEHQKVVKKQEAKKTRIMGSGASGASSGQNGASMGASGAKGARS